MAVGESASHADMRSVSVIRVTQTKTGFSVKRNCVQKSYTYTYNYKNKKWLQFLFIVKAAVLKQQISKFYPQIQRTEASDHIYFSQR